MRKKIFILTITLVLLVATAVALLYIDTGTIAVLAPMGEVAAKERDLLWISTWLMLIIIIPVFIASIWIAWRYRSGNKKAKYDPAWENSNLAEALWWGIPCVIITILSILTWKSCHDLSPYKPIVSLTPPLRIQVVALQWKWLFIYPDQKIASLNFIQFPKDTPLNFEVTADAPMNSFWIPQLGGQIYAMPGMRSQLHLIAHKEGVFNGFSANLSGTGFAGMRFKAKASSQEEFNAWIEEVQKSPHTLDFTSYEELVLPTINEPAIFYQLNDIDLFHQILGKYMPSREEVTCLED